jgi:hypothetical protein
MRQNISQRYFLRLQILKKRNCVTIRRDKKKLTSFSDSGLRFPIKEPIFYFTAKSCWLVVSVVQLKEGKLPSILMPENRPWVRLSAVKQKKKRERPDILIIPLLSLRKIIGSSVETTKISWYFNVCAIVPERQSAVYLKKTRTFRYCVACAIVPENYYQLFNGKKRKSSDFVVPALLFQRKIISSLIETTNISWNFDACSIFPEKIISSTTEKKNKTS